MNNILWNNNGDVIVTSLAKGVDPDAEAQRLLEQGSIPATAIKVCVNQALPNNFELYCWKWSGVNIIRNDTAEKEVVWSKIKAERNRRIQFGGCKVGDKWFHSDTFSRTQQASLVLLGENIPPNLQWKTMDGSFVGMTQTLAQQLFAAQAINDQSIFTAAEEHRASMESSNDPATYDYSTGWPEIFTRE